MESAATRYPPKFPANREKYREFSSSCSQSRLENLSIELTRARVLAYFSLNTFPSCLRERSRMELIITGSPLFRMSIRSFGNQLAIDVAAYIFLLGESNRCRLPHRRLRSNSAGTRVYSRARYRFIRWVRLFITVKLPSLDAVTWR